jgi:outer membrane receptor protein involved in Fe transport
LTGSEVRAYGLVNLTLSSREFAGGFQLSGSVYNLFNRIYSDPVGAEIRMPALPQNGRDFRVQLVRTFHFK